MNCPSKTFKFDDVVIERYYNTNADTFGGKPYVDVVKSPEFAIGLDTLSADVREKMEAAPTRIG